LDSLRDFVFPQLLLQFSGVSRPTDRVRRAGSPSRRGIADRELFGVENSFKAFYGELQALSEPGFLESKRKGGRRAARQGRGRSGLGGATGDAWGEIARAQVDRAALNASSFLLESRPAGARSFTPTPATWSARRGADQAQRRAPCRATPTLGCRWWKQVLDEKARLSPRPRAPRNSPSALTKVREYLTADAPETRLPGAEFAGGYRRPSGRLRRSATPSAQARCGTGVFPSVLACRTIP